MTAVAPRATYRFQLTPAFGFEAVVDLLDHVVRLGVSHLYLSPIAEAVPGSSHGYDVVDHTQVRAEFGGSDGFEALLDAAARRELGVIVDHVPNHMSSARPDLNRWWWDTLRGGATSPSARWFDVDWQVAGGRVVLPVLDTPRADVVEQGRLAVDGDTLVVDGHRRLPLAEGTAGLPLEALLEAQHYVLTSWREPERNVRRFFTVDDLVAVRVEDPDVAAVVDTLPARYAAHSGFGGVRVDHVDGLADPAGYLTSLRERLGPDALIYVEKILAPDEALPSGWPVDGTTGYEFIRLVDHVMLAADARPALDERWEQHADDGRPFEEYEEDARLEVVDGPLRPDVARLCRLARRAVDADTVQVDTEVRALLVGLRRYRTYLPDAASDAALVRAVSTGPVADAIVAPTSAEQEELRTRWQQLTGPVSAKAAEDRAFYRYLRLAALCEVGGDPGSFGLDVATFHAENQRRLRDSPRSLLAGSTHDTKRSEDVRAWSIAATWRIVNDQDLDGHPWASLSRSWVREVAARAGVDAVTVALAVQTVVSTPGIDVERLTAYLVKATREAAVHTTWEQPDEGYESRLVEVSQLAVDNGQAERLRLESLAPGISLAAVTLRLTSPGVPDLYQGTEGFSFRLVDPDNRVPPDWAALRSAATDERTVADLWADNDEAVKTVLVRTLLDLRRRRPEAFGPDGGYGPVDVGPGAIAYRRGDDVMVVVRRGAAEIDTSLTFPDGDWYDLLDPVAPTLRGSVSVASLVGSGDDGTLPVAVFERDA